MNINDLTIGQVKEIASMIGCGNSTPQSDTLNGMIGQKVIVRTYTAGVFFGTLDQKSGEEVILKDARRLWYWKAKKGISLSSVANEGLSDKSKVPAAVDSIWLKAIEIIPCSEKAITSIEGMKIVEAS